MVSIPQLTIPIIQRDIPQFASDFTTDSIAPLLSQDGATLTRVQRPPQPQHGELKFVEITFRGHTDAFNAAKAMVQMVKCNLRAGGNGILEITETQQATPVIIRTDTACSATLLDYSQSYMLMRASFAGDEIIIMRFIPTIDVIKILLTKWLWKFDHLIHSGIPLSAHNILSLRHTALMPHNLELINGKA
jgi:hypothetical protein